MTEVVDPVWWRAYREELERAFGQDEIVIRSQAIRRL